ncbi:MAG: cytochrome-c oxidase [Bacteroidetes bacterium]|nr:MAG: cytochrome-c oxidase [Bacteroidota bacterium]
MTHTETHITDYRVYGWVLFTLLILTTITITATWIDLSALTVLVALVIASVKSFIVLRYFMHLKFESTIFTVFVVMVLTIYLLVIILTFFDYLAR